MRQFWFGDKIIHLRIIKGLFSSKHVKACHINGKSLKCNCTSEYLCSVNQSHTGSALSIYHSYLNISGLR